MSSKVLEFALSVPWCLWHWCVDLLQIKFILNRLLIDVGNHVGWFDERHRERWPHCQRELALCFLLGEIHFNWLKLLAKPSFHVEWLDDDSTIAILLDFLEVLQVNREVLVELLHLAHFLVNHGPHQVELLDVLDLLAVLPMHPSSIRQGSVCIRHAPVCTLMHPSPPLRPIL